MLEQFVNAATMRKKHAARIVRFNILDILPNPKATDVTVFFSILFLYKQQQNRIRFRGHFQAFGTNFYLFVKVGR